MKTLKSFRLDEHTLQDIEHIKEVLDVKSSTDVIRKALALMAAVKKCENEGGSLVFVSDDGQEKAVIFI